MGPVESDTPALDESDLSSIGSICDDDSVGKVGCRIPLPRRPLQWEFRGLTLWLEFEEFENDLTRAIDSAVQFYGTEKIPIAHSTAIYGMTHLTEDEAISKLQKVSELYPNGWPVMESPVGVKQDIAQEGRPGQVCNIAWAELTLKSNDEHERALDKLHNVFDLPKRSETWTPHISLAYDNPENTVLTLTHFLLYVCNNPTLTKSRRVKAIALWSTKGRMAEWRCLDRINLF